MAAAAEISAAYGEIWEAIALWLIKADRMTDCNSAMTGGNYASSNPSRIYLHLPPAGLTPGYSLAIYRSIHPPKLYLWLKDCHRLCLAI